MAKMNKDDDLIIIGKKGYSYFKSRKIIKNIINQYDFGDQVIDHYYFLPLTESIMQMYEENKYANINLCYTTFVNSLVFNPRIIRLLPLDKKLFHPDDSNHKFTSLTKDNKEIIYEASREEIIKSISPLYITTLIYGAYSESRLCEFASRRNAMENATDNANELIEQLTLEYNVVRQQNITQEINEIVGGSSAGE
jgi:F-type H+-transporting ATPase subunit gamma